MPKIEKGIPIPPRTGIGGRQPKYPLADMEVGDSILVPLEERRSINNAADAFRRKTGRQFTTRTLPEGIRCWRIS